MKKRFWSPRVKALLIAAAILAVLTLAVSAAASGTPFGENLVGAVLSPLRAGVAAIDRQAQRYYDYLFRYEALQAENAELQKKVLSMKNLRAAYKIPDDWTQEQVYKVLSVRYELELRSIDGVGLENYTLATDVDAQDLASVMLQHLRRAGFNRISIGVQSDSDEQLKALGRPHNYKQAQQAVSLARRAGFDNVSVDLMYAAAADRLQKRRGADKHRKSRKRRSLQRKYRHLHHICKQSAESLGFFPGRGRLQKEADLHVPGNRLRLSAGTGRKVSPVAALYL